MTAIKELYLTSLFFLFSQISALQTGNSSKTACEFSNVTIDFIYNLGNDSFLDRSWHKNSSLAANRIARVGSAGSWTVEPPYSGRVALSGLSGITLYNVKKTDSGSYLFVILTDIYSEDGTATTTLNVYVNPNTSCMPIIENNSTGNITCKISDACPGKDSIQAVWDGGSVGVFSCPVTTVNTNYKCCAKGDALTYCYSGSLCTDFVCTDYNCSVEFNLELGLGTGLSNDIIFVICLIFVLLLVEIVHIHAKDNLQKPIRKGSDVEITASVRGFCKSGVQWIGPHGKISASKEKYSIQDNKKKRISTLKIKNLEKNDSGFYTCHAKSLCGSLAQDSVRITEYEQIAVDIDIGETFRQHGSDVNIICSVYGSENISVDWTGQKENELTDGRRYTIASYDSSTNESSLIIRTSSMTNAEGYICQVAFKESKVSVKIYITVSVNGSLRVCIEKIILFVPASENERREWIGPQENILTDDGKYTIVPYDSKTNKSHLTIKNFSMNDNGSFTCQPKNSSGSSPKNAITITTNGAIDPSTYAYKFMVGFVSIICVSCIACIVILVKIGDPCALKLGLGHGLGLSIPIVGCIIVIVIFIIKVLKPPQAPEKRNNKSGSRSDVSRKDVEIQMEDKSVKNNEERPLVIRNRIGNKDESEAEQVLSKPFDPKEHRPLPPLNKEFKDKPTHRPQPIPSEKNDVKDQNQRGLSANFDDKRGLASETPRPSKLPPIEFQVQSTVQEEGTSEGPKKTKKNRKKKEKTDERKHADETAE